MSRKILSVLTIGIVIVFISCESNKPPQGAISLQKNMAFPEQEIMAYATLTDPENDNLELSWFTTGGELRKGIAQDTVWWTVPAAPGSNSINLEVSDGNNSVVIQNELKVHACNYYEPFSDAGNNVGQFNIEYGFLRGRVYIEVNDEKTEPYGFMGLLFENEKVVLQNSFIDYAHQLNGNGSVSFVYYFKVDASYAGEQLEAIQIDVNPLNASTNWTIKTKRKDFKTGVYNWDLLEQSASGHSAIITKNFSTGFHEIELNRKDDNALEFYYNNELIYSSTQLKNLIKENIVQFNPQLDRCLFYVHNDAYMEIDYFCLY